MRVKETEFRIASMDDFDVLQQIEMAAFGAVVLREEVRQIIEEGRGKAFLGFYEGNPAAYLVVLFKNFDERRLQPLLREADSRGEPVMHDDVHIIEGKQAYFHLIGVVPEFQARGLGADILKHALINLGEASELERISCVRVNNLASIRVLNRVLKMSMVSRKNPPNELFDGRAMFGSTETNFNASSKFSPITDPKVVKNVMIINNYKINPDEDRFLLLANQGEEEDLDPNFVNFLDNVMTLSNDHAGKFVIKGVFRGGELGLNQSKSYLYFERV